MNQNTKSSLFIGLGVLAPLFAQERRGGASLTYDFRYLPDAEFEDRRIKRYKKKFPRYRIIPKYAPEMEIYVFYAPQVKLETGIVFLSDLVEKSWMGDKVRRVFHLYPTISKEIEKLDLPNHPNRKVLIMGKQFSAATEQITPFMMLHMLGEAVYSMEGIDVHVCKTEEQIQRVKNGLANRSSGSNSVVILEKDLPIVNEDGRLGTTNAVFPSNKYTQKMIKSKSLIMPDGYALSEAGFQMDDSTKNDIMSDCVASMLAKGRIDWITPHNSPRLKTWLQMMYYNNIVQWPASYQPLIDMWQNRTNQLLRVLKDFQIFTS